MLFFFRYKGLLASEYKPFDSASWQDLTEMKRLLREDMGEPSADGLHRATWVRLWSAMPQEFRDSIVVYVREVLQVELAL